MVSASSVHRRRHGSSIGWISKNPFSRRTIFLPTLLIVYHPAGAPLASPDILEELDQVRVETSARQALRTAWGTRPSSGLRERRLGRGCLEGLFTGSQCGKSAFNVLIVAGPTSFTPWPARLCCVFPGRAGILCRCRKGGDRGLVETRALQSLPAQEDHSSPNGPRPRCGLFDGPHRARGRRISRRGNWRRLSSLRTNEVIARDSPLARAPSRDGGDGVPGSTELLLRALCQAAR